MDIIDFVKLILDTLDGESSYLIYYIIAAADLYKDVCEGLLNPSLLRYRDFTDYLINVSQILLTNPILGLFDGQDQQLQATRD